MTRRIGTHPMVLKVSPTVHEYLMDTPAGREVRAGEVTGDYDPHLITGLRKIVMTTPRGDGVRHVEALTVPELDALEPFVRLMATKPGNAGRGAVRASRLAGEAAGRHLAHLREVLAADDPSLVSAQRYPLHNELRLRQEEGDVAARVLEWVIGPGCALTLAEQDPLHTGRLRPAQVTVRDMVLAYLGIDTEELGREALRMRQHRH